MNTAISKLQSIYYQCIFLCMPIVLGTTFVNAQNTDEPLFYVNSQYGNLSSVEILSKVTEIQTFPFAGRTQLNTIRVEWSKPLSVSELFTFQEEYDRIKLIVPKDAIQLYTAHQEWGKLKNIEESNITTGIEQPIRPQTMVHFFVAAFLKQWVSV